MLASLGASPSARPAKSTPSIVEKLRRESLRLSQMQDIAGCRVVMADSRLQAQFTEAARGAFRNGSVIDRLIHSSHGYRAIHIVVLEDCAVEVQVRTTLQHLWAQVSELASDVIDPAIEYGGGPSEWKARLLVASQEISTFEDREDSLERKLQKYREVSGIADEVRRITEAMLAANPAPDSAQRIRSHLVEIERTLVHARDQQENAVQAVARAREALVASVNEMIQTLMDLDRGTP